MGDRPYAEATNAAFARTVAAFYHALLATHVPEGAALSLTQVWLAELMRSAAVLNRQDKENM